LSDGGRYGMGSGSGPFKEIEIPPLNPHESRQIKMMIAMINYVERLVNPAILNLVVFDSQGNRTGHKTLYFNLKSVEEAKGEVYGKMAFRAGLLTFFLTLLIFLMTLTTFSKDLLIPLLRNILSFIKK
jgi:hypothetical protein